LHLYDSTEKTPFTNDFSDLETSFPQFGHLANKGNPQTFMINPKICYECLLAQKDTTNY